VKIAVLMASVLVSSGGGWSGTVSATNEVVRLVDNDNGVVCYVAVQGVASKDVHGISCVKVKN
jgi:hypothetical protein